MTAPPPTVLVTGCSTGIGLSCAQMLRAQGWKVFASARKEEDLHMLREQNFEAIGLDVTDSASIRTGVEAVGRLDALVNNAGFGQPGAMEDITRDAMRYQFEVNVFGLQELTNAVLPGMIERGRGRIIHISSVVGRVSLPFMGIYSASKFAVEAMADAQRVELMDTGVFVSLVEPGPIETAFRRNAIAIAIPNQHRSRFASLYAEEMDAREKRGGTSANPMTLPPEAVGKKVVHALTSSRPKTRYKVTMPAYVGALASRFLPDVLLDGLLKRTLRKRLG